MKALAPLSRLSRGRATVRLVGRLDSGRGRIRGDRTRRACVFVRGIRPWLLSFLVHGRRNVLVASDGARECKFSPTQSREEVVARKTVLVSDKSGEAIPDGKGAKVRITFHDARKGVRELDLTDAEAEALGGRSVARRGRRPKATA